MARRKGFTLIELLVVIAIIGILAAMLFPVFARARESARKIQCLSNMKNIAMAVQMYFSDYDAFPPEETRSEVLAYFDERGGGTCWAGAGRMGTIANPYLRWPVIYEEYIKNRDVWRCPSAGWPVYPAHIMPPGDWFANNQANGGCCSCEPWWPIGWGGSITDSTGGLSGTILPPYSWDWPQPDMGRPEIDYGARESFLAGMKMSVIQDPSRFIVFGERGMKTEWISIEYIAFPDVCRADKWAMYHECDLNDHEEGWVEDFWSNPDMRKQYARHLGGNNIAFADGHAKWWPAEAMLVGVGRWDTLNPELTGDRIQGGAGSNMCPCDINSPYYN